MSPLDFDAFWDGVDAELAALPMAAELEPMPLHSTDTAALYFVRLTSPLGVRNVKMIRL